MALEAYRLSIADYPISVIEHAVKRFITGKVDKHNKAFAPSVAELSTECAAIARHWELKAKYDARMAALKPPEPEIEYSEEHRRMMLGRIQALAASLKTVDE